MWRARGAAGICGFAYAFDLCGEPRAEEYELKIQGASYEEIARKGGGILNSVKKLRAASAESLKRRARAALEEFASYGTTTVEAKSGYGLDVASELKILQPQRELNGRAAAGNCVYFFGGARCAGGISREAGWDGAVYGAAAETDAAGSGE